MIRVPNKDELYYSVILTPNGKIQRDAYTRDEIKKFGLQIPDLKSPFNEESHIHEAAIVSPPQERPEKPLPDLEKIEETKRQEKQIIEQEAKAEKIATSQWWVIGLALLLAIVFFMVIGKSK